MAGSPAGVTHGAWSSGICGCCNDMNACCYVYWCPCCSVGRIAELASNGTTTRSSACWCYCAIEYLTCMGCLYSQGFRGQLRARYGLPAKPCNDLCVHCFCFPFALCQEYRELKSRGWVLNQSYAENMRRFQSGGAPPPQSMNK